MECGIRRESLPLKFLFNQQVLSLNLAIDGGADRCESENLTEYERKKFENNNHDDFTERSGSRSPPETTPAPPGSAGFRKSWDFCPKLRRGGFEEFSLK